MKRFLLCLFLLLFALSADARTRHRRTKNRLPLRPKGACAEALTGSHASQELQNEMMLKDDLYRALNDDQLRQFIEDGKVIAIKETDHLVIDSRLDVKFRFCRPWTAEFLDDIGSAYHHEFGKPLQVNSAIRTIVFQHRLEKVNSNAASALGERASSHPSGATVDIAKIGMSPKELAWMRQTLCELEGTHLIEATEEFKQAVFHIMVFKAYVSYH